jgi:hypothetical protein
MHVVKIISKSMVRYEVKLSAESLSPHLCYGNGDRTWNDEFEVSGRGERIRRSELHCADLIVDQGIKLTVSYEAIGCIGTGAATMLLRLDTSK